ncbi:MAG: bifunctional riboflavin kinase/FAD synthetase [Sphingomonadaceae bacterium]
MVRLDGGERVERPLRGGIVALGNFDGFHLGHQAVVGRAVALAREQGRPAIAATFDPHPVRHFRPETPPFRLTTLDQRARLFAAAGADAMLVFGFDGELASVTASDFITDRLIARAGAAGVVTGEDFTFGKARGGDTQVLADIGGANGLLVETVGAVTLGGETVSSSRIRDALKAGDCATATRLLTRPFAIEGMVQHGDKNGRLLGYPTANLALGSYLRPRYGIYAVRGRLADGRMVDGAANLGVRPQFDPPKELLEAYFFDFSGDLYEQVIEIELHAHLRDEAKFDDLEALKAQMARDCAAARAFLATVRPVEGQ